MSLPIAWVLRDKHILLVGGGEVAETRVRKLVPEGAKVVVVAPKLTPYNQELADAGDLKWINRDYKESDLDMEHWSFVLTAIDEHEVSKQIAHACRQRHIPVNVADVIPLCDFYFGANFQQGPLKVMVSTGSSAPRLAKRVLNELAHHASEFQFSDAIENVSVMRALLRKQLPGSDPKIGQTRMLLMKTLCDKLSFPELAAIKREEMEPMIRGMLLSTAACPAHPIGDVENAEDFVGDVDGQPANGQPEETSKKRPRNASGSESGSDSDSIDSSSDSDSDSGSDSDSDSESGDDRGKLKGTMKRTAVECVNGFPTPRMPSFPFNR